MYKTLKESIPDEPYLLNPLDIYAYIQINRKNYK